MKAQDHTIGRALAEALEPLIDICLESGITTVEFERIVRQAFVMRAFEKLPKHPKSGRPPTAHKVGFAVGLVHHAVSKIRRDAAAPKSAAGGKVLKKRGMAYADRVIQGWLEDPKFQTSGGQPLDLPLKPIGGRRSFQDLINRHAPGKNAGTLLKELVRRGQVQLVDGEIARFKRATVRTSGITPTGVADAARQIRRFGSTLYDNLRENDPLVLVDETKKVKLTEAQIALLRARIQQKMKSLIQSVELEYPRPGTIADEKARTFGVGVYSWKE
jgi:hypothetical protein